MNDGNRTIAVACERVEARGGVTAEWGERAAQRYAPLED